MGPVSKPWQPTEGAEESSFAPRKQNSAQRRPERRPQAQGLVRHALVGGRSHGFVARLHQSHQLLDSFLDGGIPVTDPLQRQLRPAHAIFERQQASQRPGNPDRLHLSVEWKEWFEILNDFRTILRVVLIPSFAPILVLMY